MSRNLENDARPFAMRLVGPRSPIETVEVSCGSFRSVGTVRQTTPIYGRIAPDRADRGDGGIAALSVKAEVQRRRNTKRRRAIRLEHDAEKLHDCSDHIMRSNKDLYRRTIELTRWVNSRPARGSNAARAASRHSEAMLSYVRWYESKMAIPIDRLSLSEKRRR